MRLTIPYSSTDPYVPGTPITFQLPTPTVPSTAPYQSWNVIGTYTLHVPFWVCDECARAHATTGSLIQPKLENE